MERPLDPRQIEDALSPWGLETALLRTDLIIQGSPDRTGIRVVVEDDGGRLYILEQCVAGREAHRYRIAEMLDGLAGAGLRRMDPYLAGADGSFIPAANGSHWQLRRFTPGVELPRPMYIYDKWRGGAAANFLLELRQCSASVPGASEGRAFSLPDYVDEFLARLYRHKPEFREHLSDVMEALDRTFLPEHDRLPTAFCHGDYHPMNIVWGEDDINTVIDWEFCGLKPELYDVALLTGCMGMENPECLTGGMVKEFLSVLRKSGFAAATSWEHFRDLVVAIRLAWLKEWFRHGRTQMIELEVVYMRLLLTDCRLNKHLTAATS